MGVFAHTQLKQAVNGEARVSAWFDYALRDMLSSNRVEMYDRGEQWEIIISEDLKTLLRVLKETPDAFKSYCGPRSNDGCDRAAQAAIHLIEEGLEAAEKNDYCSIIIDWY